MVLLLSGQSTHGVPFTPKHEKIIKCRKEQHDQLKIKTNGTVRNLTLPYPGQSIPDIIEKNSVVTVSEVTEPESLKYMEGHEWNIDEINFLAKRMESFDKREKRQFDAIASQLKTEYRTGPHQSDFQSIEVYPNLRLQQSYRDRQDTCHQQKTGNEF